MNQENQHVKKKQASFVKFMTNYLQNATDGPREPDERTSSLIMNAAHRQYWLLCEGIRDVRIGDTAIYAWDAGGGEW